MLFIFTDGFFIIDMEWSRIGFFDFLNLFQCYDRIPTLTEAEKIIILKNSVIHYKEDLSEMSINTRVSDMRILHIDTPARLLERKRRKRSGRPLVCADRSGTETMKDKLVSIVLIHLLHPFLL